MNEKYQQLYQYLQSNGMTDLSADEFYNTYGSDKQKYNQLYGYLVQNQMTDLSSESFYQAYFGGEPKKKDLSPASAPSSGGFSSLRGTEVQASLRSDDVIMPYRGSHKPQASPSYNQVMHNFVRSSVLSDRNLGEISDEAVAKYGFTEDDWRSAQIQQAMEAPMEELPQMIDQRQAEIIAARRKALEDKANQAFIPQLVKETFPNAPGLYEGLKFYMESEGTYTSAMLDIFDDIARGIAGSLSANDAAAEVADIMVTRGNVTLSQAEKFMNAANEHQRFVDKYGVSAEMLDFQQSIQDAESNGENTTLAALYAIGRNPSILPTITLESLAGLFNKASATAFASTVAGSAAGGAAVGAAAGGVGAIPGAIGGAVASVPFAFGAASTTLETTATFVDLLQQEMANRGMQWTPENIQVALNNEDIYNTVASNSVRRGIAIGIVDGVSMGVGGAASKALVKRGLDTASRVAAIAPIESAFGAAGEFAGQLAAGQKISGADILIEGLAEAGTAPLTVGQAMLDDYTAKSMPSYTINDKKVDREQARRIIESSTPESLKDLTITINNDPELSGVLEEKAFRAQVADRIDPAVSSEDRRRIINLELERRNLSKTAGTPEKGREADAGQVTAHRMAAIDAEIADINNSYINRVTENQPVQTFVDAKGRENVVTSTTSTEEVEGVTITNIEAKRIETEAKIKNKDLFLAQFDENGNRVIDKETGEESKSVGEAISQSDNAPVPTAVREINGIEFVEFSNPKTGDVDVVVTGKSNNDFVGFYRLYENGKPTNKWSSKFQNPSRNKEDFKTMISGVQEMLPAGHEYTEKTSISTDGLRVWNQQLSRGYELQYDENGKLITNSVFINGDAIVNELGIPVERGEFERIKVTTREDFEKVKAKLLPYLERFGLDESSIKWISGNVEITPQNEKAFASTASVKINLPILRKTTEDTSTLATPATPDTRADIQAPAEEVALQGVTVQESLNRPATLTSFGGVKFDQPVKGDLYVQDQTLVFETQDKVYEIGNYTEVFEKDLSEVGLQVEPERVRVLKDETIEVDGESFEAQLELPTLGIEYDDSGNVARVSLKKAGSDERKMFEGRLAEDVAYQVLLANAESPQQVERVNQLLEQDEQFQREHDEYVASKLAERVSKPVETKATAKKSASKVPVETPTKPKSSPIKEKPAPAEVSNPSMARLSRLLSIETEPVRMATLVAQHEDAVARGTRLTQQQQKELDDAREQLRTSGYSYTAPNIGERYVKNELDEVAYIPDKNLPRGEEVVSSVSKPEIRKNGQMVQPAKLVVRRGTASPMDAKFADARAKESAKISKPKNKAQLAKTFEVVFGLPKDKAKADAAVADVMIANMAKRDGISKEEMYGRVSWEKAKSVTPDGKIVPDNTEEVLLFQENIRLSENGFTRTWLKNSEEFAQLKADGLIDNEADIESLFGTSMVLHVPDAMSASDTIRNGTMIMEGQGGVYYPLIPEARRDNLFWVSTTPSATNGFVNSLNKAAKESKDGKIRLVLVSTNMEKLRTSHTFNTGFVRLLEMMVRDPKSALKKPTLVEALTVATTKSKISKKKNKQGKEITKIIQLKADLKKRDSFDVILDKVYSAIQTRNFQDRILFSDTLTSYLADAAKENKNLREELVSILFDIGNYESKEDFKPNNRKNKTITAGDIRHALERGFCEPILRDMFTSQYDQDGKLKNGMIYASIEVDVNPNGDTFRTVETAAEGLYTHKSYGFAAQLINPESKVKVNVYKNREYWGNVVEHPSQPGSNMPIGSDAKEMERKLPSSSGMSPALKAIQRGTDATQILMQGPTVNKKELAQNTKAQVDRIKGLDVAEEDGATFNYEGTEFSEGTGLVVPVGSFNTTQSELTPEMIADYINTMKEVFATDEVKFGLYKFPNSDKVSIDINIMVPEDNEALAMKFARFAGQFSVFKMSDFSTIQTGASGKNPKTFSKQQYAEIAQRLKDNNIDPFIENNNAYSLPEEVDAVMTQDEEGNYVFRHYSDERRDQVKPMAGEKTHTSRDEAAAIGQVGGVAMYYVDSTKEVSPNVPHIVKVPKNRVYYFNEDKLNLFDQALESYRKFMDNPNAKFPSFNHQLAWVTKAANENGFDMVVSEWNRGPAGLRAQTTRPMTPVEGDFKMSGNTRQLPNLVPGDNINVRGQIGVFVGFNGEGDNRTIEYVTKAWDGRPDTIKEPMWRLKDPNYDKYFVSRLRTPIYKLGEDGSIYNIDNKEQVYFQNQRAAIAIKNKEGVVYAISSPDVTSPLHELAHLYEQYLTEEERATVLEWAGHEEWGRDTSEAFAEGFEKFLYDGSVSNLSLVNIFKSFKNWLGEIYSSIKGTPLEVELSDKMRQLYDTMLSMHEPENSIHSQQAVDGVYYQGPMNDQGQSEYEPSNLSNFRAALLYFRRVLQDKYAEVLWLTEDVKAQGRKVGLESDFRMMEELMPGKTMSDFKKFEAKVEAAKEFMRKNKMVSDDLSDYLYALHAPSRNQRIFEKYGKENGSGMSNEEAGALIEELEQKYPKEVLEQGAQMFKDMLAENRQIMIEFGLEPQDVINSWEQDDTYVPLYGVAIDEMDVESSKYPTGGSGIHVYGRTSKKAKGRKSKATNVLANIIVASTALRIKARKNEALVSLLNLVQQNPSSAWSVETSVEFGDDSTVGVRVDGQQLFIRFKNRALAEQLKNMGVDNVNVLNKILSLLPTAWLRKSLTTLNPEFFIPNFTRDLEAAIFNAAYESEEGGIAAGFDIEKEVAKIKKKVWPVMKSLVARANGRPGNPVINQYMDEMIEDGGLTGYTYAKPISEIARELDRDLSPNKLYLTKKALGKIGGYIEGINDAFEQTIRLSVYIAGREKGMSRPKAAQLAKNITVNFNKYGEWGITLNQLKLFFGASIQGSYRFFTTMGSRKNVTLPDGTTVKRLRKAQKLGLGLFGLSSALTAINIAMSGEDEDGELFYNKIPDHEKQRNLILMYDKDKYFKLPMAYGFGVLSTFGEAVTSASLGERDADDAFIFSMSSILNSFSPVQFGSYSTPEKALITTITPSGLAAFGEAAINETFFGTAVYREQMPFGTPVPEYQLAYKSPKFLKDMAQWMNESTGGSEYTSGALDFNPDRLYHYWNFYIGGAGRFVDRTGTLIYNSAEMIKEGERVKMTTSDLPLVRQIYGELGRHYDYDKFRDNLITTKQLLDEYEDPKTRGEKSRYGSIYLLSNEAKRTEKMLKTNREKIRLAEQMENYVDRQNRIFELYEEQRLIMMRFNKLYNEKGPKED